MHAKELETHTLFAGGEKTNGLEGIAMDGRIILKGGLNNSARYVNQVTVNTAMTFRFVHKVQGTS
jgi:hypothetical protein